VPPRGPQQLRVQPFHKEKCGAAVWQVPLDSAVVGSGVAMWLHFVWWGLLPCHQVVAQASKETSSNTVYDRAMKWAEGRQLKEVCEISTTTLTYLLQGEL
jgi:hypothetical protein